MVGRKRKKLKEHSDSDRLSRALERCLVHLAPWSGVIYRATGIDYANRSDLLSGLGSKKHGARWTPIDAFPTVYGSFDPQSALLEAIGTGGKYGVPYEQRMPLVMVAVEVKLNRVLDLTLPDVRSSLRVSLDRMLEDDWEGIQRRGREALTQAIARIARDMDVEGLVVPSARLKGEKNVAIFPERIPARALKIQNVRKLPK